MIGALGGLRLVEHRLRGQVQRLDESILRLRSLVNTLDDVSMGVVRIRDDDGTIAQALIVALQVELGVVEDVRTQIDTARATLRVRVRVPGEAL